MRELVATERAPRATRLSAVPAMVGVAGVVVVIAVALRTAAWWQPHTLTGVQGTDDGVYYGAAALLLRGVVPYADVTLLHPPAAVLALVPAAAVGAWLGDPVGMAVARALVLVVAVAGLLLVRRRAREVTGPGAWGEAAAVAAMLLVALHPGAVDAERTVLLEPLASLPCLLAVGLLLAGSPRRLLAAGALLGVASSVKVFALGYLVAGVVWLLLHRRVRDAALVLAGLGAALAVLVGPFLVLAPGALWRDVVDAQLTRPKDAALTGLPRAVDLAGLSALGTRAGALALAAAAVGLLVAVVRRREGALQLWALVLAVCGAGMMGSSVWFPHYGGFLAPPLAVCAAALVPHRLPRPTVRALVAAGCAVALVPAVVTDVGLLRHQGGQGDHVRLSALVGPHACVWPQYASAAIAADLLRPPTAGCPYWLDPSGVLYTWSADWPADRPFYNDGFRENARWQRTILAQLRHADVLLLAEPAGSVSAWSPPLREYARTHFTRRAVVPGPGKARTELWARTTPG